MRSHSTKFQLKEKIPRCQKHSVEHLSCTVLRTFSKIQFYSVVFFRVQSQAHSALGSMLAAPPSCPELHTRAWSLPGVGGALARPRRRLLRRRDLPWRPTEGTPRQNAVQRRPKPPGSPRGLMHASARPWHHHRGPASTERAPCRRRAAPPPFRRAHP